MNEFLITPLLALHLLCVNVASAGPLVCLWLEWKEGRGDALAGRTTTYLANVALLALLVGGGLGAFIGLLSWNSNYESLWTKAMYYKAAWGLGEYVFSLGLGGIYILWRRSNARGLRPLRYFLLFLNGSNLLYHFPFLFTVASDVHLSGNVADPISAAEFRAWMARPDVLARAVHVVFASFAVTGVVLIGYGLRLLRDTKVTKEDCQRISRWGAWLALIPSLVQVPVGLWLIAALPANWQDRALGDDPVAVGLLGTSFLLVLFLLQDLASLAFGEVERKLQLRSMAIMVLVVLLMTGVLRRIRPAPEVPTAPITAANRLAS